MISFSITSQSYSITLRPGDWRQLEHSELTVTLKTKQKNKQFALSDMVPSEDVYTVLIKGWTQSETILR